MTHLVVTAQQNKENMLITHHVLHSVDNVYHPVVAMCFQTSSTSSCSVFRIYDSSSGHSHEKDCYGSNIKDSY